MAKTDREEPRRDQRDPHATALGRGVDPGTSVEGGPIQGQGIAGPRGDNVPGEKGGPSGEMDRDNEDSVTLSRRDQATID
jgi:hypothetical protein